MLKTQFHAALFCTLAILVGCNGSSSSSSSGTGVSGTGASGGTDITGAGGGEVASKVEHPEGDAGVSAEDGGPGFTGEGWETAMPEALGDPRARKGGNVISAIYSWPDNLRMYGSRSNTQLNYLVRDMCYETLVGMDANTLDFIPGLASHWKVAEDNMTFTFRINPKAHWSDGEPVTSEDFVATYRLLNDDTLEDPMTKAMIADKFEEPVAKSKYILEVVCKVKHWRNFISFVSMIPLPAHQIGGMTGAEYLEKFNFDYTATTGPYIVHKQDIKTDESVTLTRRDDYWNADDPSIKGLYNFKRVRFVVVRDHRLAFDKAVKGELDFHPVYTSKWWVEDLDPEKVEAVKNGLVVRRKVFTKFPKSFQGEAFNLRMPIFQDVRVRKALAHLHDRKTLLEKFMYNEYEALKSYYPGSDSENLDNELVEYDPQQAADLLAEAGWTERGPDGILIKGDDRFSVTIQYGSQGFEKYFTIYKEAAKKVGVEINLQLLDPQTRWANAMDHKFEISSSAWGAILFPNPLTSWHSSQANDTGSNNYIGFANEKVDALIDQYDQEFDLSKRNDILRQIDGEIFKLHPYFLDWYLPNERMFYWNKFGMPDTVLRKYDEWDDVYTLWWIDPEKDKKLKEARKSGGSMPLQEMIVKPWDGE
jgi:microcin C transport system substrate-binding protein